VGLSSQPSIVPFVPGVQEILLAIKLVKFYVWESSFAQKVSEVSASP